MTCTWCGWPTATPVHVENVLEKLCADCAGIVARHRIANVRL